MSAVTLANGLATWAMLVGAVSSEVFEQFGPQTIANHEAFFTYQVAIGESLLFGRG